MKLKAILFDLDGTLLPMDQNEFVKMYFYGLIGTLSKNGYEPEALKKAMWVSIGAMIKNTGERTNEQIFWRTFSDQYGRDMTADMPLFERFYEEEFDKVSVVARPDCLAPSLIKSLRDSGYRLILATNPVFPRIATKKRARWAGIDIDDFTLTTSYENSSYSKPNLDYYREILDKLSLSADECLMVGNDTDEDMIADALGMRVFLITKYMINKSDKDISIYPQGDFSDLARFITELENE